ncbi:hypothetical protein Patl1_29249 [Pistacia atlantica]|uniref:Uncharacterized protein n=1 Tax=Pistacia atlantica TaxID=434234 RepID=A0ACC1BFV8_9ROSI|nr:hypothetical protein Patl1_29249 [Pistacia atlantica]
MSASCGSSDGWLWFKDPRLDCLGCREIFPSGITFAKLSFFFSVAAPLVEADKERGEENYGLWRLEKGVAKGSTEILKEVEQRVASGSEVINVETGKKAGKVTTALGCCGLGVLRLEEAFKVSGILTVQGQDNVRVEAMRPQWWPAEWFQEHQQDNLAVQTPTVLVSHYTLQNLQPAFHDMILITDNGAITGTAGKVSATVAFVRSVRDRSVS